MERRVHAYVNDVMQNVIIFHRTMSRWITIDQIWIKFNTEEF
jgi:hypothetical protein